MLKQITRFEQVPLEIVKRIIEIAPENTSESDGVTDTEKEDVKISKMKKD